MTRLVWYTIKLSVSGIRDFEVPNALIGFQNLFDGFPHLKNIRVSLVNENVVLVQLDTEDLYYLSLKKVGERATEEVLEALPAVLTKPSGVTVHVLEVRNADSVD